MPSKGPMSRPSTEDLSTPGKFVHTAPGCRGRALQLDVAELDPTLDQIGFGTELSVKSGPRDGNRRMVDVARFTRNERFRRGSDRAWVSSFWVSRWPVAFGGSGVRRVLGCRRR
jgi:hypothetical protein